MFNTSTIDNIWFYGYICIVIKKTNRIMKIFVTNKIGKLQKERAEYVKILEAKNKAGIIDDVTLVELRIVSAQLDVLFELLNLM